MKNNYLLILATIISFLPVAAQQPVYSLFKTIQVGDESSWDYLAMDTVNRNLYISHGTRVLILNTENDSLIAEVPNTAGVHGIAFNQELGRAYISNGRANSIVAVDLKTFQRLDSAIVTGINPDAILYDPYSRRVFAFNGKSANATVFDAATLAVIATIPLPGKPEFSVTGLNGSVYVNIEDKDLLVTIDAMTCVVSESWSLAPGIAPSGLAIDREKKRLFSVCDNNEMVVSSIPSGKVVDSVHIGGKVDAVVFDPQTGLIYSSNGEGNVTIIRQLKSGQYKTEQVLTTQKGCKTMAIDQRTGKIYLPSARFEGDTRKILPGTFNILVYTK